LLWNPKADHAVHKSSPLNPILSQLNSVHIHFNIILPYTRTTGSPKWPPPLRFPDQNSVYIYHFPHLCIWRMFPPITLDCCLLIYRLFNDYYTRCCSCSGERWNRRS